MSIILLADDSPHAQRMGERILREEGFEVVSITNGETALLRLADVDPDLVIADVFLPGRNGFELCRQVKATHRHVRVILTAVLVASVNEEGAHDHPCDPLPPHPSHASLLALTHTPTLALPQPP